MQFIGKGEFRGNIRFGPWVVQVRAYPDDPKTIMIETSATSTASALHPAVTPVRLHLDAPDSQDAAFRAMRALQVVADMAVLQTRGMIAAPTLQHVAGGERDGELHFAQRCELLWADTPVRELTELAPASRPLPQALGTAIGYYARAMGQRTLSERFLWLWVAAEALNDFYSSSKRLYHRCPSCDREYRECPFCGGSLPPARPDLDGLLGMFERFAQDDGTMFKQVSELRHRLVHSLVRPDSLESSVSTEVGRLESIVRRSIYDQLGEPDPIATLRPYELDVFVFGVLTGPAPLKVQFPVVEVVPTGSPQATSMTMDYSWRLTETLSRAGLELRNVKIGVLPRTC